MCVCVPEAMGVHIEAKVSKYTQAPCNKIDSPSGKLGFFDPFVYRGEEDVEDERKRNVSLAPNMCSELPNRTHQRNILKKIIIKSHT